MAGFFIRPAATIHQLAGFLLNPSKTIDLAP